jgi:hypothetical protein
MHTNHEHLLRANEGSYRLGLPVARLCLAYLIHGLKPVATNSEPLWGSSKNLNCCTHLNLIIYVCISYVSMRLCGSTFGLLILRYEFIQIQ